MSKKPSIDENAIAFRSALACDLSKAAALLEKQPELLDYPVYGRAESALHFFAVENRVEIVRWLVARKANPEGINLDHSPLLDASTCGNLDVCRELLKAGADPNRMDFVGETPLHRASAGGYTGIIELLLDSGADPNLTEEDGELPIDRALLRKRDEVHEVFDRFTNT